MSCLSLAWVAAPAHAAPPVPAISAAPAGPTAQEKYTGPWKIKDLTQPPRVEWGDRGGVVQSLYYSGENFQGKPTRVFAYVSRPPQGQGPFPAMVLVHGGGGTAFPDWAALWAARGYVAIAMDLSGSAPGKGRLPDGGPGQSDDEKFRAFQGDGVRDMWTYHAVSNIMKAQSVLAGLPEVDAKRIGITGISWGGYLTCIAAGVDERFKVAVPVYGCGFLQENSYWKANRFDKLPPEQRDRWIENFEPSKYLKQIECPTLFVNGTNDFAYPLDSYQKTYQALPKGADLCVRVAMPHGHREGWAPIEIGLFVDSVLKGGTPLPKMSATQIRGAGVSATVSSQTPIVRADLHYTTDAGPWQQRRWQTVQATVQNGRVSAVLPTTSSASYFLTAVDARGALVSTPHAAR